MATLLRPMVTRTAAKLYPTPPSEAGRVRRKDKNVNTINVIWAVQS